MVYILLTPIVGVITISLVAFVCFIIATKIPCTRKLLSQRINKSHKESESSDNRYYQWGILQYINQYGKACYSLWRKDKLRTIYGSKKKKDNRHNECNNVSSDTIPNPVNVTLPNEIKECPQSLDGLHSKRIISNKKG